MLIPLGILASAGGAAAGSYELISTTVLGTDTASVSFDVSSLASTYKHLQIRATVRDIRSGFPGSQLYVRFNSDTAANYSHHQLYGSGSSVSSAAGANQTVMYAGDIAANDAAAYSYSPVVIDILDPFSTSKYKTIRGLSGTAVSYIWLSLFSGSWRNTAAVTSIQLLGIANLRTASRFSLYGIKG